MRGLRLAREPEALVGEVRFDRAGILGARLCADSPRDLEQVDDP